MKINSRWVKWKIWVAAGVGALVLADILLCVVLWQTSREAPEEMQARRDRLAATATLLNADVARGERIRASLNQVGANCDEFYKSAFLDPRTVYSTVDTDIADIASKSGVKTSGFSFKRTDIPDRSVAELSINTTVDGDYPALLKFVSAIEQSKNFYFLNQLQLGSGSGPSGVRLQLELHTYVRI